MKVDTNFPTIEYINAESNAVEHFSPPTTIPITVVLKPGERKKIKVNIHSYQAEFRRYVVRKIDGLAHPVLEGRRNKKELELLACMRKADTSVSNGSAPLSKIRGHRGVLD